MMKFILVFFVLLVIAWIGMRSLETRSLYYPDRFLLVKPDPYHLVYDDVKLRAQDGTVIDAWYIPGKKQRTILLCHGNAGNISHRIDKVLRLRESGAGVLLFDYRGYGLSEGSPSEKGTYQDAEAAYRFLTETKKIPADQIVLYGESLGCAVALEIALRHPAAGLILESPFTSTLAMAHHAFPWLPAKWTVRYRYDNLSKIPRLAMPLLILHSPQDEIIPFEMGKQLYAAAPEPKQFFQLGGGHNDGYADSGDSYINAVKDFLKSVEKDRP
jgi:uncharacterized protein